MVDRTEFVVTFKAKDLGLLKDLKKVGDEGVRAGSKLEVGFARGGAAVNRLRGVLSKLNTRIVGIGTAIAAAFGARQGIGDALKFGNAIAEVGTIAGVSAEELEKLRQASLDIATKLGLNEVDTAQGLYQTLSAGITNASDALLVLEQASRLAVAGVSTTNQTVDLLTSVLNAYGLEATDAAEISDKLFETVRLGKTTIDELAASIGSAAPIAATVGVSFDELAASIATVTLSGLSTSEAATQVRSVITALGKKGTEISKIFSDAGRSFQFTDIQTRGLIPVLQDLRLVLNDDSQALINLLGRQEAVNAVFNLTGQNAERFVETLESVRDATDTVSDALSVQFASAAGRFEAYVNSIRQGVEELGTAFIVAFTGEAPQNVEEFGQSLTKLRDSIADLSPFVSELTKGLLAVVNSARLATASVELLAAKRQVNLRLAELARTGQTDIDNDAFIRLNEAALEVSKARIALFGEQGKVVEGLEEDYARVEAAAKNAAQAIETANTSRQSSGVFPSGSEGFAAALIAGAQEREAAIVRVTIAQQENTAALAANDLAIEQSNVFQTERTALLASITSDLNAQREAVEDAIDAEFVRVNALVASNQITREQGEALKDLLDLREQETIAGLEAAAAAAEEREARIAARETTRELAAGISGLQAELQRSGISTIELTALLNDLREAAREADVEGVAQLTASFTKLLEQESQFGASFIRGLRQGKDTLGQIGEDFGQNIGGAFEQLSQDLLRGEQGFDSFKDTAIRAIAQVIQQLLVLKATQFATTVLGFSEGGTQAFGGGGVKSFAGGGFQGFGGQRVNVGSFPTGGVAKSPTLSLFGDQSKKFKGEAFVPIPADAQGIPVEFRGPVPMNDGGGGGMTFNFNMTVDALDSRSLNDRLAQAQTRELIIGTFTEALGRQNPLRDSVRDVARGA